MRYQNDFYQSRKTNNSLKLRIIRFICGSCQRILGMIAAGGCFAMFLPSTALAGHELEMGVAVLVALGISVILSVSQEMLR